MRMIVELIQLLAQITKELFLYLGLLFGTYTFVVVTGYNLYHRNKVPKEEPNKSEKEIVARKTPKLLKLFKKKPIPVPDKITNVEILYHDDTLISKPTTMLDLIHLKLERALPLLIVEGNDKQMLNQIKEYLQNHIKQINTKLESVDTHNYEKGYAEGSLALAEQLIDQIEQIHMPIWGVWLSDFEEKLSSMDLLDDMDDNDFRKLLALANEEFQMDSDTRDYDLENFIEQTILQINPETYGIYEPGAVVRIKDDLIVGAVYTDQPYLESMDKLKDRTAIITSKNEDGTFELDIDIDDHKWTQDMVNILQNP